MNYYFSEMKKLLFGFDEETLSHIVANLYFTNTEDDSDEENNQY